MYIAADPGEHNDLINETQYEDVLQELIAFAQDEYYNRYKVSETELVSAKPFWSLLQGMPASMGVRHPWDEVAPDGYLASGWCDDYLPLPPQ